MPRLLPRQLIAVDPISASNDCAFELHAARTAATLLAVVSRVLQDLNDEYDDTR
jgi:hypothetical protein